MIRSSKALRVANLLGYNGKGRPVCNSSFLRQVLLMYFLRLRLLNYFSVIVSSRKGSYSPGAATRLFACFATAVYIQGRH